VSRARPAARSLPALLLALAGCASFMAWNQGKRTQTADCTGLDEERCGKDCCDNHLGVTCNPWADGGRCEYTGEADHQPAVWCGGPLGCVGASPDGGRDGH
jgi:hypothetical protein